MDALLIALLEHQAHQHDVHVRVVFDLVEQGKRLNPSVDLVRGIIPIERLAIVVEFEVYKIALEVQIRLRLLRDRELVVEQIVGNDAGWSDLVDVGAVHELLA